MIELYGNYRNRKFSDLFESADEFLDAYKESGLYASNNKISDDSCKTLFYLLYSNYGNSTIASSDENQFKYQIFTTIYEYGPTWEKKIDIQNKVRGLTDPELIAGGHVIYNSALNPGTAPSTQSLEELTYINSQNTTNYKKSKIEAYSLLYQMLITDVTREFLNKFKRFFLQIVLPELPLWYGTEVNSEEEED